MTSEVLGQSSLEQAVVALLIQYLVVDGFDVRFEVVVVGCCVAALRALKALHASFGRSWSRPSRTFQPRFGLEDRR